MTKKRGLKETEKSDIKKQKVDTASHKSELLVKKTSQQENPPLDDESIIGNPEEYMDALMAASDGDITPAHSQISSQSSLNTDEKFDAEYEKRKMMEQASSLEKEGYGGSLEPWRALMQKELEPDKDEYTSRMEDMYRSGELHLLFSQQAQQKNTAQGTTKDYISTQKNTAQGTADDTSTKKQNPSLEPKPKHRGKDFKLLS